MNRITDKDLTNLVNRLNVLTGNPVNKWSLNESGSMAANIGNYHVEGAYGGVKLCQIVTHGGGNQEISRNGYGTKRHLHSFLLAYIDGIQAGQDNQD